MDIDESNDDVFGEGLRTSKTAKTADIFTIDGDIVFTGGIDFKTAHDLIHALRKKESEIITKFKPKPLDTVTMDGPSPIRLFLSSKGGVIHAAFAVIDAMAALRVPVHTIVQGYVASAATLISLAGAKRYITPNSYMMIHELRSGSWGRYSELRDDAHNATLMMDHLVDYYTTTTKLTEDAIRDILRHDMKWHAKDCIKYGLADGAFPTVWI